MGRKVWAVWSTATLQVKLFSSIQRACGYYLQEVEKNAEEFDAGDADRKEVRSVRKLMECLKEDGSFALYGMEGTLFIESKEVG